MKQFSFHQHIINAGFKKQFFKLSLLLFFALYIYSNTNAQCTVNPVPNQVVCNNTATAAINFTGTATTFNWVNNTTSIGLAAGGTGNIISFTALNASATAVTATITVTPSAGACTGTPISFTITVNPSPVVVVTPNSTCGGPCNSMTASGNADSYSWAPLAGLYTDCPPAQPYTGTNVSTLYTAPNNANLYTVTGINLATGCVNSAFARPNYTPSAPVVVPPSVSMCLSDPPVLLTVLTQTSSSPFCSGPVNIAVPDNNPAGASNNIVVSGIPASCNITAISVTINMPHTRIGNMVFVLKAPNGQIINLDYYITGTGGVGSTTGFLNTVISSLGTSSLSVGANPYTATFRADLINSPGAFGPAGPTGMLPTATNWISLVPTSAAANGSWTLGFYDGISGDVGTLFSWCLNFTYSCGSITPAAPAVWTPAAGLYMDAAATVPYIPGFAVNSIWTRPVPAGVYPYQVTTQGIPAPLCTPTTNFVGNNTAAVVTFNLKNNHPFPIKLFQINSKTVNASQTAVSVYYKTSAVNGLPGVISPGNGWNQFGGASIAGTGTGIQSFISNLQLVIPPGATYGICLKATDINSLPNLAYTSLTAGNYSFNDGGCELVTGTNIGYSGNNTVPGPATALSGFIGSVQFVQTTATCPSPPTTVIVTVGQPVTIITQPVNQTVCAGNSASYTVGNAGTGPFVYQWQTSANAGGPWTNLINAGVFSGANTNTLLISSTTTTMNGNFFRVVINGGSGCSGATSTAALLTVNPLPNIVISANPLIIGPGQTTTIRSAVTPNPAATYTWYYNASVLAAAAADTLLVDINGLGDYQLKVTDVNGCSNLSNIITIAHSFALTLFTYPNPSAGLFQVRYHSEVNNMLQRSLTIYNNHGEKIMTRTFTQTVPYQKIEVDIRANGKGLYWIELNESNGKRLSVSRVLIE